MKNLFKKIQNLSEEQIASIQKFYISICSGGLYLGIISIYCYQLVKNASIFDYTDFRNIYTGATMGLHHAGIHMYMLSYQFHIQQLFSSKVTTNQELLLPFLTPPFVALFLSPLALVPASTAYIVWGVCNIVFLLVLSVLVNRLFQPVRWQVRCLIIVMVITFFPVWEAMLQGQLSFLLTLSAFFGWYFLTQKKDFFGGIVLSLLVIKPHFIFLILLFLLIKRRSAFFGLLLGLSLLFLISLGIVGIEGMKNYATVLISISSWGEAYGMHPQLENTWGGLLDGYFHVNSLKEIWDLCLFGSIVAIGLFLWTVWKNKSENVFELQWAFLILLIIFIGPHVFTHDLSLLTVVGIAIAHYLMQHRLPALQKNLLVVIPLFGYVISMVDYMFLWRHMFIHLTVWFIIVSMFILSYVIRKQNNKHRV